MNTPNNDEHLFKNISLAVALVVLTYIPIYYILHAKTSFLFLSSGLLFFESLILILNHYKKFTSSKIIFIISCNFYIYSTSLGNAHTTSNEYYCLPAMMLGLLLFKPIEKLKIVFGIVLPILTWIMIKWGNFIYLPSDWSTPANLPVESLSHINFVGSSVIMTIFLILFMKSTNKFHQKSMSQARHDINLLSESESKLKLIFETMTEGMVIQDSKAKIIQFNKHALDILGLTEDQLLGRTSMDPNWQSTREDGSPFPGEEHPAVVAMKTGQKVSGVVMGVKTLDQKQKWIQINAVPFKSDNESSDNENDHRVICTFSEITEQRRTVDENRFVLDALQIGVWKYNPQTQSLEWDKSMYRLFDINESDFTGHYQAWESTLTPEAKEKAVEELRLALTGEKEFNTVFEIQNKNGNRRYIAGRAKVIRDKSGSPVMMYGINYDVTKEITTEKHLKEVTENSPGLICQIQMLPDGSTTMPYVVSEGLKMFDLDAADYENNNNVILNLVHPDESQQIKNSLLESSEQLTPFSWTGRFVTKLGLVIWCSIKCTPSKIADGNTLWSGFILDVTKEKSLEADLASERAKALHTSKLASLGEMSAGVAHEINNPLAIIAGTLPLLPKFKDDPVKYDAKMETLMKSVERITKIVKGLRKFSRSTEDSQYKPEILADIVLETITLTDSRAKRFSVKIEADVSSSARILCDEVEIEQVIINLINNAIDAVKELEERWVRVKIIEYANEVILRVYDSGKGIPVEIEEKLFNPFFTTKPVGEGTGLGLSISKGIIEQHKGTLKLKKDENNTVSK